MPDDLLQDMIAKGLVSIKPVLVPLGEVRLADLDCYPDFAKDAIYSKPTILDWQDALAIVARKLN